MPDQFAVLVCIELGRLLTPLEKVEDPDFLTSLLHELGWGFHQQMSLSLQPTDLRDAIVGIVYSITKLGETESPEEIALLVIQLFDDIKTCIAQIQQGSDVITGIVAAFDDIDYTGKAVTSPLVVERLFDYLVYTHLQTFYPRLFAVLHLLTVVELVDDDGKAIEMNAEREVAIKAIHWGRMFNLISSPLSVVESQDVYGWSNDNDISFNDSKLLSRLELLMKAFLLPGGLYKQTILGPAKENALELRIPLYQQSKYLKWKDDKKQREDAFIEAGLSLTTFSEPDNKLALVPYFDGVDDFQFELGQSWELTAEASPGLFEQGLGLEIQPPHDLTIKSNLFNSSKFELGGQLQVGIVLLPGEHEPYLIFGSAAGTRLSIESFGFKVLARHHQMGQEKEQELGLELVLQRLAFVLDVSKGDGFIQSLLSDVNIETVCDITLAWTDKSGFHIRGSAGLNIDLMIQKFIGPVFIDRATIGLAVGDDFELSVAASFAAKLGPIAASVDRFGIVLPVKSCFDDFSGNLGPLDIKSPKLTGPEGVVLAVDAEVLTGSGGLVKITEPGRTLYFGEVGLSFGEFALNAVGMIETPLPDGSAGYALLINIGAVFDPPIQLAMGFTLSGVGGLIGVNRSMNIDALRKGVRNRTLDSILFPDLKQVAANTSKMIRDMREVFPASEGQFIIGPMVKIGWGNNIITADIGLLIELPDPIRIVLLGQVEALLPKPDDPLVVIHLDILGVIDFDRQELSFQASLYDSRILTFSIYGDAAFLLGWGRNPRFALALGGFHPKFKAPEPASVFADLRRLTIDISAPMIQLTCQSYLAITSNTLQFGAQVDLHAQAGPLSVDGMLGFDALFFFSPFAFDVEIRGGVHVKFSGHSLFGVSLVMQLIGPTPWFAHGKVKFKILFISFSKSFTREWGDRKDKVVLEPVNPVVPLLDALASPYAWRGILPAGQPVVESLRSIEEGEDVELLLHPSAGQIELRQNAVPLQPLEYDNGEIIDEPLVMTMFGNAPIETYYRFDIAKLSLGNKETQEGNKETQEISGTEVHELFARGQYFETENNEDRLQLPAYEKMKGGMRFQPLSSRVSYGESAYVEVGYEVFSLKPDGTPVKQTQQESLWSQGRVRVGGSLMKREIRRAAPREGYFSTHIASQLNQTERTEIVTRPVPRIQLRDETYRVIDAADPQNPIVRENLTRTQAQAWLRSKSQTGAMYIVPDYEVAP